MNEEIISQERITKPFRPKQAIIIYEKDRGLNENYYLETHDIISHEGKYHWQEGRPLLKESLKELALSFGNESFTPMDIAGTLPDNILYFRQTFFITTIIWYLPPGQYQLKFKDELKIPNAKYRLPGLIFCASDGDLSIVAFKGNKKPNIKTQLYKAPFHNMHINAQVCLGNIREHKTKNILQEEIKRWERRFFNSNFTHFLDTKVVKGANLQLLFKKLANTCLKFPENALVKSKYKTLDKFIKNFKDE